MPRFSRLCLAVLSAAAVGTAARAAEVDPILPKEAEQVIFVNFKQLMTCDLVTRYMVPKAKEAVTKSGEAEAIFEALGLDPFKDVYDLTVALWEKKEETKPDDKPADKPADQPEQPPAGQPRRPRGPQQNVVAVVRGKFDPRKLWKAVGDFSTKYPDRVAVVTEDGLKMVRAGDKDRPMYILVADAKTVLAATTPQQLADALKAKTTKAKAGLNRELAALVLRQDAKASMYICQLLDGKLAKTPLKNASIPGVDSAQFGEQIGNVTSFSLTARVGKEIGLEVRAGMKDPDAAESFGVTVGKLLDLAKKFLPLAALQQPKAAKLIEDIVKTVQSEVKKGDVVVTVKLTAEAIGSVLGTDE